MKNEKRRTFLKSALTFFALVGTLPIINFFNKDSKNDTPPPKKARFYKKLAG